MKKNDQPESIPQVVPLELPVGQGSVTFIVKSGTTPEHDATLVTDFQFEPNDVDIEPGVFSPLASLEEPPSPSHPRDISRKGEALRRQSSDAPVVTPFYGDSGMATEYMMKFDGMVGYKDTPTMKPPPGGKMTYQYQVVITDTQGDDTGTGIGAPLGTFEWSFGIVTSSEGLTTIENLSEVDIQQGSGSSQQAARFAGAMAKFNDYYRNPNSEQAPERTK